MILECRNLTKSYRGKRAVSNLNVRLEEGKIYGLLGENGSGKTTWMKMMAGLAKPSQGEIFYNGHPLNYMDKNEIAYMATESFYYDYMKVSDVEKYYADFFQDFNPQKFKELIARFGLDGQMKARNLSSGMNAKLRIAATLARDAKLCMLDEPLNGVDYKAREDIISIIVEEADENRTFVISTHLIEEVESFVEKAIFIKNGELIKLVDLEQERAAGGRSLAEIYISVM
ncbi:MAG TPA: ABC transporter ATP-binding protein [Candidatus Mediterraneibacter avicola]|nr:ABC transporter ATP-binding protein [Candidatus Mediterraneibacter avicola]